MSKELQRISVRHAILLGVLVVLVIGLVGCVQLSSDRPPDRPVREGAPSTSTELAAAGQASEQGEGLFAMYCRSCHGEKGTGTPLTRVVLRDAVRGMDQATLSGIISKGLPGAAMPAFGNTLTGDQMTDLVAFIRSW